MEKNGIGVTFGFVIAFYGRSAILNRGILGIAVECFRGTEET